MLDERNQEVEVMDEVDRASLEVESSTDQAIAAARRSAELLFSIGQCYYCSEPLHGGLRFCDADCRDDYEFELAAKRRNAHD